MSNMWEISSRRNTNKLEFALFYVEIRKRYEKTSGKDYNYKNRRRTS